MKYFAAFVLFAIATAAAAAPVKNADVKSKAGTKAASSSKSDEREKRTLGVEKTYSKTLEYVAPLTGSKLSMHNKVAISDGGAIVHLPTFVDSLGRFNAGLLGPLKGLKTKPVNNGAHQPAALDYAPVEASLANLLDEASSAKSGDAAPTTAIKSQPGTSSAVGQAAPAAGSSSASGSGLKSPGPITSAGSYPSAMSAPQSAAAYRFSYHPLYPPTITQWPRTNLWTPANLDKIWSTVQPDKRWPKRRPNRIWPAGKPNKIWSSAAGNKPHQHIWSPANKPQHNVWPSSNLWLSTGEPTGSSWYPPVANYIPSKAHEAQLLAYLSRIVMGLSDKYNNKFAIGAPCCPDGPCCPYNYMKKKKRDSTNKLRT